MELLTELKEPWEAETGMQKGVHVTGRRRNIPGGGNGRGCTLSAAGRPVWLQSAGGEEQAGDEACGSGREVRALGHVRRASFPGLSSLGKYHSVPVSK